jgi:hypothetical protein
MAQQVKNLSYTIFYTFWNNFTAELNKKISILCKKSLVEKWYENSLQQIDSDCPFCRDAHNRCTPPINSICNICLCPSEICGRDDMDDYLLRLMHRYPEKSVKDMLPEDLKNIQQMIIKYTL